MRLIRCNTNQNQTSDWDQAFWGLTLPQAESQFLAVDITEDDKNITVTADLPGLKKEEIRIAVENDVLSIRGERKSETQQKEGNYSRVERFTGVTERRLQLGTSVDQSQIVANYKNGVLEIVLPKSENRKSRIVEISE